MTLATQALASEEVTGLNAADVIVLQEEGWPQWLREAFDHLEAMKLGRGFMYALEWWTVLERAYEFKSSTKGLSAVDRPPEIHHWLRVLRRVLDKPPHIEDEAGYSVSWWKWWTGMQPDWRRRDAEGHLVRDGSGSWEALSQPGKNGILIVLLSLAWWRNNATEVTLKDWDAAVQDVGWVIKSMARAAGHGGAAEDSSR
ncbi:hypothetical protein FKP32DRAFT_1576315 [Trametes sanguinea]|nr:hypothetical protein FKP32DRAFT_1576315 [Trametes sanguinea]